MDQQATIMHLHNFLLYIKLLDTIKSPIYGHTDDGSMWVFNRNLVIREQSFLTMLDPSAARIVENGAAHHTHDTSFIQIALTSGIEYAVRIQAYGFGFESLVCTFGKASQMPRWMMVLGSCSPQEKSWEKSRSTVRPA